MSAVPGSGPTRFHYVYILQSEPHPDRFYTGLTDDLPGRIKHHNSGSVPHTSKFRPWFIKNAIAFRDRERAVRFEHHLKSHSGRAFAKKHL
jgi:predicted GIY-YIG superfamily endonuclease